MEKFEITDENIQNTLRAGGMLAHVLENELTNKELLLFWAVTKLYLRESALRNGVSNDEFESMCSHAESVANDLFDYAGRKFD